MSLKGSDGSTLAAHVRPLLGWEVIRGEQLARVLGKMKDVLGTLEDDLFPGAIIPMVMNREMHYYAVAPTQGSAAAIVGSTARLRRSHNHRLLGSVGSFRCGVWAGSSADGKRISFGIPFQQRE